MIAFISGLSRWVYGPVTLLIAVLAGFFVSSAALHLSAVPPPAPEMPEVSVPAARLPDEVERAGWPDLFGAPLPPAATTPPPPEPAAPPPPSKLVVSYVLKGLIAGTKESWAILGDATSDQLVRVGDMTSGGEKVIAITAQGVELGKDGLTVLVTFVPVDATAPPNKVAAATVDTGEPSNVSDGDGQDISTDQGGPALYIRPLPVVKLRLSEFKGERLARVITRAVGVAETQLEDGTSVLEILWVRNGLLYDRISLKQGDKIKTINGRPVVQAQSSVEILQALIMARSFEIELVRNDVLRSLKVEVQDAD